MANYPTFAITPRMAAHPFSTGDSTTAQNIMTGGDNGTRITAVLLYDTAGSARVANAMITNGTAVYRFSQLTSNGNAGVTESLINGLNLPVDAHNNKYVVLPSNSWSLAVELNAAVASTNDIVVTAFGADF